MRTQTRVIGGLLVAALVHSTHRLRHPVLTRIVVARSKAASIPWSPGLNAIGILFYRAPGADRLRDRLRHRRDLPAGRPDCTGCPARPAEPGRCRRQVDPLKLKALIEVQTGHSLPLDDPRLIQHSGSAEQLAAYGLRPAA